MRYNRSCCNYGSISYRNTPAQDGIRADPNVISYSYFVAYQTRGGGNLCPFPKLWIPPVRAKEELKASSGCSAGATQTPGAIEQYLPKVALPIIIGSCRMRRLVNEVNAPT